MITINTIKQLGIEDYSDYKGFFTENRLEQLNEILKEIKKDIYFPNTNNIFRFMNVPIDKIKCIFIGQDAYANYKTADKPNVASEKYQNTTIEADRGYVIPEATGRSFEVNSMTSWTDKIKQSSLRNILKSLYFFDKGEKINMEKIREEILSGNFKIIQPKEWFDYMEEQGVVFLNTSLTVKMDEPGSHLLLWEGFMDDLVKYINEKNPEIQWILAGKVAQDRITSLINYSINTCHPRLDSFVVECPFKRVDNIDWIGKNRKD